MAIDFLGAQGGQLAVAAFTGASFVAGVLWKFIVVPLKLDLAESTKELKDYYISELEFYKKLKEADRDV